MTHTPETLRNGYSETILGIAPDVLVSTQNFEDCRNTLNDWLAIQRADNMALDFDDANDLTLTLAMEAAEAFGVMADSLIRSYGAEGASPAIAQAWLIDDNERAQLLNSLSGTEEIIVHQKEDFEGAVFHAIADDIDAKKAGTKLAAEFGSILHGNIAEYVCLLEDSATDEACEEGYLDISLEDLTAYRDVLAMKSLRTVLGLQEQ